MNRQSLAIVAIAATTGGADGAGELARVPHGDFQSERLILSVCGASPNCLARCAPVLAYT